MLQYLTENTRMHVVKTLVVHVMHFPYACTYLVKGLHSLTIKVFETDTILQIASNSLRRKDYEYIKKTFSIINNEVFRH